MASPASKRRDKSHSRKARTAEPVTAVGGVVIRRVKKGTFEREHRNKKESDLAYYLTEVADMWPDERFTAPDGRRFAYLGYGSDAIRHRIEGKSFWLAPIELRELARIDAAIVELPSDAPGDDAPPPFTFIGMDDGDAAWRELVASFTADAIEAGEEDEA